MPGMVSLERDLVVSWDSDNVIYDVFWRKGKEDLDVCEWFIWSYWQLWALLCTIRTASDTGHNFSIATIAALLC